MRLKREAKKKTKEKNELKSSSYQIVCFQSMWVNQVDIKHGKDQKIEQEAVACNCQNGYEQYGQINLFPKNYFD